MNSRLHRLFLLCSFALPLLGSTLTIANCHAGPATNSSSATNGQVRVLIIDGRNNHDWEGTTHALRQTLNQSGRFEVRVSTAPPSYRSIKAHPRNPGREASADEKAKYDSQLAQWRNEEKAHNANQQKQWKAWQPDFDSCDVVVNNYNGPDWPEHVRQSFLKFVQDGGGVVNIHAANNAFSNWDEFNQMIGLGWRKVHQGKRITINDETGKAEIVPTGEGANSGHGGKHPFVVKSRHDDHPIMRGLPAEWMHGKDELYHAMRGPASNVDILASAFSSKESRGTGKHEPILWTTKFGEGRVVTNTMGHVWLGAGLNQNHSLHCVGFQTILGRSVEWAATGKVSIDLPKSFPGKDDVSIVHPEEISWTAHGKVLPAAPNAIADPAERAAYKKKLNPWCLLTPEETIATAQLPPGYKMELVVSEPHIYDPVLAVWDGDGVLYVAEMRSYMQDEYGTGTKTLRNGRITRHEDTSEPRDGIPDRHTVFVDGLNLPRMLLPLDDRIAVIETDSTSIHSYRDTDGDGVADEKKLMHEGARKIDASRSVEHQDSGLFWSIDNWVYLSRGRERYQIRGDQLKLDKIEFDWNQWGLDQDETGRLIFNDNSHPANSFQQHPVYWNLITAKVKGRWNKPTIGQGYKPEFLSMHSICELGDRGESHAYQSFTSATGGSVFKGQGMPEGVKNDYFIADPTGHIVRRSKMKRTNGKISFENAYEQEKKEFLAHTDINFRPINTHTGPDGCLYVVDMHRGMIQDAPWVNDGMKTHLRRSGLNYNIHHGRIYRIYREDYQPTFVPMLESSSSNLVELLRSENGWVRETAQKLIVLRGAMDGTQEGVRSRGKPQH